MKFLTIILISFVAIRGISNRSEKGDFLLLDEVDNTECSRFYEFGDTVLDLFSLKPAPYKKEDIILFKKCSPFKNRFATGKYGFDLGTDTILKDQHSTYQFTTHSTIKITYPDSTTSDFNLPLKQYWNGKEEKPFTLSHPTGIILIYEFQDSSHIHIYKMKNEGEITGHVRLKYNEMIRITGNKFERRRFLYPIDCRQDYLVLSSGRNHREREKTVVLNLNDFSQQEYDFSVASVIWDDNDAIVKGFILAQDTEIKMYWKADSSITALDIPEASENFETLIWGYQLIVANYSRISSGCSLHSFDLFSKEKMWTAKVLQLEVDHSKYYNKIMLTKYQNKILLEGEEAYGDYLQVFEMQDGKRLAEFGDVKK